MSDTDQEHGEAAAQEEPRPDGPPQPETLLQGTFAIYPDGKDGAVISWQVDGQEPELKHIPAAMLKMGARIMSGGGLRGMIGMGK